MCGNSGHILTQCEKDKNTNSSIKSLNTLTLTVDELSVIQQRGLGFLS